MEPNNTEYKRNENGTFAEGTNPGPGRPKGKTMKEFAREYLLSKTDEQKRDWLETKVTPEIVWKMAEGMPKQDTEVSLELTSKIIKLDVE